MRITFVLPDISMAGGSRVIAIHAERLQQRGHHVTIVSRPRPRPDFAQRVRSLIRGKGWRQPDENGESHFDHVDVELRLVDARRSVSDADVPDADVVIATWWETAEWVARLAPGKGAKVYFIQGYETFVPEVTRLRDTWTLPLHKIVISRWLQEIAASTFGDIDVSLVPNSVDLKQFNAPPRGLQKLPTIGMVYSQLPIKQCDMMLRAFQLAAEALPGLTLVAFGHEAPPDTVPLPAGTNFVTHPPQDQLKDLYASCDAWLFGSKAEGFGLPILEAMACRTPVIATPAGAAPELLADGGGILLSGRGPAEMAGAILEVFRQPEFRWRAMSDAAYRTATQYTWDDASRLFEAALTRAIEGKQPVETAAG